MYKYQKWLGILLIVDFHNVSVDKTLLQHFTLIGNVLLYLSFSNAVVRNYWTSESVNHKTCLRNEEMRVSAECGVLRSPLKWVLNKLCLKGGEREIEARDLDCVLLG